MADKCVKKHFINTAVNYKAACGIRFLWMNLSKLLL